MKRTSVFVGALAACLIHLGMVPVQTSGNQPESYSEEPETGRSLDPQLEATLDNVRSALSAYGDWRLNTRDHNPWEVMHAIVAYGVNTPLLLDGPTRESTTAVGWLCFNGRCQGQKLFYLSGNAFSVQVGPGVQGHEGQFLAMLAQSHVMTDYPIRIQGREFTVVDLIEHEKVTCVPRTELTFKLISLAHYLDTEATWTSVYGEPWSIQRLIREELAQPIRGATCGGTHRLMGLSYAVRKRAKRGEPMVGEFLRANVFLRDYHNYTFKLQNPDGSFSTDWFRSRADAQDVDRKLKTTGHILEWLAYSLPQEDLADPHTIKAVNFLADILLHGKNRNWEIGPLGHALHALMLYEGRFADENSGDNLPDEPQDSSATLTTGEPSPEDSDAAATPPDDQAADAPSVANARDRDSR